MGNNNCLSTLQIKVNSTHKPIINSKDILYSDTDVCILYPNVKKGILVFTHYTQHVCTYYTQPIYMSGLKTGAQLQSEGINFGRTIIHPYIFFRAPYFSNVIDYTSIDTEIESSFGKILITATTKIWIRIDPDKTYVYSSEIRARYNSYIYINDKEQEIIKSRKLMTNYLEIIDENSKVNIDYCKKPLYNLLSSQVRVFPIAYHLQYPWDSNNININSEVLVRMPHLTPKYFVKCT
jgi:hypothetical protein